MRYEQLRLAREAVCQERIRERERAAHVAGHEQAVAEAQEHLTDVAAEWEIAHRALDAKYVEGQSISESIAVLREIVTAAERLYEAEVTLLAALDDLTTIRDRDPLEMLSRPEVDAGSIAGALRAADGKPFLFDSDELFCPVDDTELPEGFEHSCAICHEPFGISNSEDAIIEHPVRLPCHASHIFGSVCLHSWIAEEKSCPMCRARFAIVEAKEPEGLDRVRLELIEEALVLGFPAGILEGLVGADGKIWEDANAHEKVHAFREIEPWDHDVIFGYAQPGSELDDPVGVSLFFVENVAKKKKGAPAKLGGFFPSFEPWCRTLIPDNLSEEMDVDNAMIGLLPARLKLFPCILAPEGPLELSRLQFRNRSV
ncbi:MAG: hypothetical protein M1818_007386 [Claussenomyces sp. TS43310]|nr:MAG: hypothetical protein M1818_007386 [Claussenomyces sp. TS43310]